jgi:hypothetical protein
MIDNLHVVIHLDIHQANKITSHTTKKDKLKWCAKMEK